jgi:hypothetical protein
MAVNRSVMSMAMRVRSARVRVATSMRMANSHRGTMMTIVSGMDVHRSGEPSERPARKDHQDGKSVQHSEFRATSGLSETRL